MSQSDIKRANVSLEEGDAGFLLTFPPPPSGSVPIKDQYIFSFDAPYRLPLSPKSDVIFSPNSNDDPEKESYIKSSIDDSSQIGIQIKSIHKAETQTLVRLQIKDIYNNLLYTDYILVICTPTKVINLLGTIVTSTEKRGPNNGRVLRVRSDEAIDAVSQILTRMQVTGPGIPNDVVVTVYGFIEGDRAEIELAPFDFQLSQGSAYDTANGLYTFTQIVSCPSPEDLKEIEFNNRFLILDVTNNWSYLFRDKLIAQFIFDDNVNDQNLAILLPIKNFDAIIGDNLPAQIPSVIDIYGVGRVINDTVCLSTI